jgi:hypothetical protein
VPAGEAPPKPNAEEQDKRTKPIEATFVGPKTASVA